MATPSRRVDRHMQHTRQILQKAFMEVAQEKGLVATTIQDITKRADVNRGTFYLHFADKYMLIDTIIREQFRQHVADRFPPGLHWDKKSLHLLILALLQFCEEKYRHQPHLQHVFVPQFEQTIYEELTRLLLMWLKGARQGETQEPVTSETMVRVAGWAILGTTIQWSREESTTTSEQMAHDILQVVLEGLIPTLP